jgi:sugar phosphate isomerase/epimerase
VKLSLSVRIAESLTNKDRLTLPFLEVLQLAREIGYPAICARGSIVSVTSPVDHVAAVRRLIDERGLAVSMVTGDVALAVNDAHAVDALRDITPYLDLAEALGTQRLRVMMQSDADFPFAQRSADEANERGLLLCHQTHQATLCETIAESLEVVRRVNRRNFGLTYEPANLLICGDDYGAESIKRLGERIFNVYLQNFWVTPDGTTEQPTNHGIVRATPLPLGDKRGVDLDRVFEGLSAIGYNGWVTVHSALVPGLTVEQSARQYYDVLVPYVVG